MLLAPMHDLRRFLRTHRDALVLSAYLEARPSDPAERRNRHVRIRQAIATAREALASAPRDERELFDDLVQRALDLLPKDGEPDRAESWACFVAATGERLSLSLPAGIETGVFWGLGATVVPLVRVLEPEGALVAQVDRSHARLSRVRRGGVEVLFEEEVPSPTVEGTHMGDSPRVGFHSGTRGSTATDDLQRQRREATERLHASLVRWLVAHPERELPLVLGGAPTSVAHLRRALPSTFAGRTIVARRMRLEPVTAILPQVQRSAHDWWVAQRTERWQSLTGAAQAHGPAAVGLEAATRAAEQGAIAELMLTDDAWRAHPREVDSLTQRAIADGADVTWAPDRTELVAALRFPIATNEAA